MKSQSLGLTAGRIVTAEPGGTLADLDPGLLMEDLAEAGFLVLRGFGPDLESYSELVQRSSTRTTLDPARVFHGPVAQKVDAGTDAVALHQENATTPFVPHLVWLFCEKAATSGSQTTVCDGYAVWEQLSPEARKIFQNHDLLFAREVSEPRWKHFVFHLLSGRKTNEEISVEDLLSVLENPERTTFELRDEGRIYYEFRTPAVHPTRFGDREAFCNGMLTEAVYYEPPKITFDDGSEIPGWLKDEVNTVTAGLTMEIDWHDGDVLLLDNTRMMHGRRAILDPERILFNAQSYIDR
jgi:alpha-ketoglutarate-dependent taurine dioxygenase